MSSTRRTQRLITSSRRYPSDLTDSQWHLIEPLLPPPGGATGTPCRPLLHSRRRIMDGIMYTVRTGCAWRQLPHDLPAWQTVYWYFTLWNSNGTLDRMHDALRDSVRVAEGRKPEPTAGIVDAQSIRGADTVGKDTRGYDAGKKVNGRKRNIVVDTLGMLLVTMVTAANMQDRDGGTRVIENLHQRFPSVRCVWADGAYAGLLVRWARMAANILLEIVCKTEGQRGFKVLPRRWVVERTFSWLMRCRRLCRDYERSSATSEAVMKWAMVGIMVRRLARSSGRQPWASRTAA